MYGGGGAILRFAPIVPWAKAGPAYWCPKHVEAIKTEYFVASGWFFTFTMSMMHGHMDIKSIIRAHIVAWKKRSIPVDLRKMKQLDNSKCNACGSHLRCQCSSK
jgi:hypothetical protein